MTQPRLFFIAALLALTALEASGQTAININCGGQSYTALDGAQWMGDSYFDGGDLLYTSDAIGNSQDLPLYRSGRAGLYGDFTYNIPVPNGAYSVTLHFAEIQYWQKGDRVFNVAINGTPVLTNFDILAVAVPRAVSKQQFTTVVTNGMVQIAFTGIYRRGLVNAIQVEPAQAQAQPPSLNLSSGSLSFSGTAGGANPAAQNVTVSNAGGGSMAWTASGNQNWLTVSPASGTNAGTLAIGANLSGLPAGTYTGAVSVTAAGAAGSPKTLAVTLTVASGPALTVSTSSLSFSGTAGGANPATQNVTVSNAGGGSMTWAASGNQNWLTVSPASGTNAGTLAIGADLSGLAAGTYTGAVSVTAAGAAGSPKTVAVTLTLAAGPALTVSTSSLSFSGTAGGANPAGQNVTVSNAGGGSMAWTASGNQNWLTVSPASGTNAGTPAIGANLSGLAAGTYTGAVSVTAAGAGGSPKTISVTLTVSASTPNTQPAININCGGRDYTAVDGTQWIEDYYFTGGDLLYTSDAIANSQDLPLYRSGRAGLYGDFSYSVPVQNGLYTVTLHFAEIQYWNPGDRVFNVTINGSPALTNFDILSQAAPRTAIKLTFPVNVATGAIRIDVTGVVRKGLLNGIQIASADSSPVKPPALTLSGSALTFSGTAGGVNPPTQSLSVSNTGSGAMAWAASSNQNWLTVSPGAGLNSGTLSIAANLSGLAAGNYTGTITVTAAGATGSPKTVAVTLNVAAPPALTLSTAALAFSGTAGGANPVTQTVAVSNSGGGTIAWTASTNQNWLTLSPASGTNSVTLTIGANLSGLAAGSYTGTVTVTAGGATGSPKTVAVTLNVAAPPPSLTVSSGALVFAGTAGGPNPASQYLTVSNVGGGTMAWTATGNQSWLLVSPASGTNSGTLTIGVSLAGLAQGTCTGVVTVSAAGAGGSPKTIGVTLNLGAAIPPSLSVSATTVALSATAGGATPAPQNVSVSNMGGGTMPWTAAGNQTWLTVSPASGTDAGTLAIGANVNGLAPGTYAAAVTVTAAPATGSPQSIAVTLTVAGPTLAASPNPILLNCAAGTNPYSQTLTITATGNPSWMATKTQPWLTLSQTSGSGSATLTVSASAASMPAGTYSDVITIAGNAMNAPAQVGVTMTVSAAQPPSGSGASWYVAPNGSAAGDGSINRPWDIVTALNHPAAVRPGDTIWLRAGKYGDGQYNSELISHLVGTPALPIVVRAYPKERAIIDAWLLVGCCDGAPNPAAGSYTWFWNLEFASYNPNRTSGTSGPPEWAFMYNHEATDIWGAGTKFINCIVHDTAGGLSVWNAADAELTGNIVFNIGGYGSDRGHGHDFYLQNQAPSVLTVTDNIGFNGFDMGLQAYGSSDAPVQNMHFSGNVVFQSGVLYGQLVDNLTLGGGSGGPGGMALDNNIFYNDPNIAQGYNELGFLWTPRAHDAVATNNYFIGGKQAIDLERWDSVVFQNNTVYSKAGDETMLITRADQTTASYNYANNRYFGTGQFTIDPQCDYWPCPTSQTVNFATWMALTGLDRASTFTAGAPTGVWTSVRPNQYEPGRANVVIFNWDLKPSLQVDLSGSGIRVGDPYQIRDAENWFGGAVVSGTYTGTPVTIPMSGLVVAQPFGVVPYPPSHTAPQFGVFVLLSGNALNVY